MVRVKILFKVTNYQNIVDLIVRIILEYIFPRDRFDLNSLRGINNFQLQI